MNNNSTLDIAPGAPNNITIPIGHANIFYDAFWIISTGIVLVAFIALLSSLYAAVLWLHYALVDYINSTLGKNRWDFIEAGPVTYINGQICGYIIVIAGFVIWAQGEGSVSFVSSFIHAFGIGVIILAFLLVVELAVLALCSCTDPEMPARTPAADDVEMGRSARPMMPRDETSIYAKGAIMTARDEANYSKV